MKKLDAYATGLASWIPVVTLMALTSGCANGVAFGTETRRAHCEVLAAVQLDASVRDTKETKLKIERMLDTVDVLCDTGG